MPQPKSTIAETLARRATPADNGGKTPTASKRIDWTKYGARRAGEGDDRLTWRPATEGDTITGRLKKVDEVTTKFGEKIVVELVDCQGVEMGGEPVDGGDYSYWPTQGALDALFAAEADEGETVKITLVKLIDTGRGNPFKAFEVANLTTEAF